MLHFAPSHEQGPEILEGAIHHFLAENHGFWFRGADSQCVPKVMVWWSQQNRIICKEQRSNSEVIKLDISPPPPAAPWDPVLENHKQNRDKGQPWQSPTPTENMFDFLPRIQAQLSLQLFRLTTVFPALWEQSEPPTQQRSARGLVSIAIPAPCLSAWATLDKESSGSFKCTCTSILYLHYYTCIHLLIQPHSFSCHPVDREAPHRLGLLAWSLSHW